MSLLVLNAHDLAHCLNYDELRSSMRLALIDHSFHPEDHFPRYVQRVSDQFDLGLMPARNLRQEQLGYKIVAVSTRQKSESPVSGGEISHQGFVVLLDPQQGLPLAILEASTVTAYRTAAASAAATEWLSQRDSRILGLIGAGRQAWEHLQAIARIRPIEEVLLWSRSPNSAFLFAEKVTQHFPFRVKLLNSAVEVARVAQILVTATASHSPHFSTLDLAQGVHVNAIGACRPGMHEIAFVDRPELRIFMDSSQACSAESSEIILGLSSARLSKSCLSGELGYHLQSPMRPGRQPKGITIFKSVGLGIEDLYAGNYFYRKALQIGIGTKVEFP